MVSVGTGAGAVSATAGSGATSFAAGFLADFDFFDFPDVATGLALGDRLPRLYELVELHRVGLRAYRVSLRAYNTACIAVITWPRCRGRKRKS